MSDVRQAGDQKAGDHKTGAMLPRALRDPLPVRLWMATGLFCALSVIAGFCTIQLAHRYWLENMDARVAQASRYVDALPTPDRRRGPLVAFVGSSRIHHAIADPRSFAKQISGDTLVSVFHTDDARAAWIAGIMPVVERAHPDLLFVQYEILEPPLGEPQVGFLDSLLFDVKMLRYGVDYAPAKSAERQCAEQARRSVAEILAQYVDVRIPSTPTLAALPALKRFQRNGTRVVILDLPRAAELERTEPAMARWRKQTVSALQLRGFEIWTAPGAWKKESFCDYSHLNAEGRARFDLWLAARIQRELSLSP